VIDYCLPHSHRLSCNAIYKTLFTRSSKLEANLAHTSRTCILNTFASCMLIRVNGVGYNWIILANIGLRILLLFITLKLNTPNTACYSRLSVMWILVVKENHF